MSVWSLGSRTLYFNVWDTPDNIYLVLAAGALALHYVIKLSLQIVLGRGLV